MQISDWNDLRLFLVAAEENSVASAARAIGVVPSTLWRHLRKFESRMGTPLFVRNNRGYVLTDCGLTLREHARQVRALIMSASEQCATYEQPCGRLRLATSDALIPHIVAPTVKALRQTHPQLIVEVTISNSMADVERYEADLALRVTGQPPPNLIGRKMGELVFGIYGASATADKAKDLNKSQWVIPSERHKGFVTQTWLQEHYPHARIACQVDSMLALVGMIETGMGLGLLPRHIGKHRRMLREIDIDTPMPRLPLWLLHHPDMKNSKNIRVFAGALSPVVQSELRF
jgi:DNA-binding transcriptional LysR family regulator